MSFHQQGHDPMLRKHGFCDVKTRIHLHHRWRRSRAKWINLSDGDATDDYCQGENPGDTFHDSVRVLSRRIISFERSLHNPQRLPQDRHQAPPGVAKCLCLWVCRVHHTLCVTPAMEADVTDRV